MTQPLSPDDRDRLETLFAQAAELSPIERETFVERACGTNNALRQELARLLDGLAGKDHLTRREPEAHLRPGTRIGPYKLLELIGEGGMGQVYTAQQLEPVSRRVALKVIKPGIDSAQITARFEAEFQALARMTHPSIAQVYDAGTTDAGHPYFVMEFVAGVPIIEYCDRHKMSTRERLELFLGICAGVQHAHQKGIIHRDLKPSNLLVTEQDGRPVAKIIDFGVARAITGRLAEHTLHTMAGQVIGTLDYMSPEQADPTALDIDTRSDVYSLGVVLYELVTGVLPFTQKFHDVGFLESVRMIKEEEPPKPSTRLADSDTHTAARNRSADARTLIRELRGDLDWITLKTLEKDRARRYGSAVELAADVRRHLDHEPVSAGRPGTGYRIRKFVRRNRVGVTAGLLVLVGIGAALFGLVSTIAAEQLTHAQRPYADAHLLRELQEAAAEPRVWPPYPDRIEALEDLRDKAEALKRTLEAHRADLEEMKSRSDPSETATARQETLTGLVAGLEGLLDEKTGLHGGLDAASPDHGWSINRRLAFARQLEKDFDADGKHEQAWVRFRKKWNVDLKTQTGLVVPIDRESKPEYFEFAHLMTGAPAVWNEERRKLDLDDHTGVVLVLIPGGSFTMGPPKPTRILAPRTVQLSRYFLSKYEMTQGQWQTLTGHNPSRYCPDNWERRWLDPPDDASLLHPVEQVSWKDCAKWLGRAGLSLPTDAQWEYGARGGKPSDFWSGDKLVHLKGIANISDDFAHANGGEEHQWPPNVQRLNFNDGSTMHARVDRYRANAFGLHDVHGSVFEWCRDGFRWDFLKDRPDPDIDPVGPGKDEQPRIYRGGSYRTGPRPARVWARQDYPPGMAGYALGVRPGREVERD